MVCSMKSMSKTRLPSECASTAPPSSVGTCSSPCTQCGCPPTTRSAPAPDQAPADLGLHRLGDVGVLRAPVGEHDHDVDAALEADGRPPRTWARSARSSGPVRGGIRTESAPGRAGGRLRGLADGVEADEAEAHAVPGRARPARDAAARSRPAPKARSPAAAEPGDRVEQRGRAEVAGVVVGQRDRVDPERRPAPPAPSGGPRRSRRPAAGGPAVDRVLSRLPTVRSAPAEVAGQRSQRRDRVAGVAGPAPPRGRA